ncbi:MAG: phosphohistidine phosphatase, SixA [Anaerolineae bacterium]|jgi:phosphohistidine phosphatase|nr:MAG: phosphohistidine phosphatase, SixA [Anaerolineae bacterium]
MNLYLLRHAIADLRDPVKYPDDSLRPLTKDGKEKFRRICAGIGRLRLSFDLVVSSPYTRARQTAEIFCQELKISQSRLIFSENLTPFGDPQALFEEISAQYTNLASLVCVGHEPYLSELIGSLLCGNAAASITMKKGGFCCLTLARLDFAGYATLEWLLTPAQMIAMS